MKSITVIFLIASCLFFSCSDNKQENPALLDNFILPQDTKSVLSSLLTDNYEITQLETTENCLIGKIDKIRKIEGHYYFLSDNKTILHFNEQGEFVSSLNKQGQGPEEYRRIEDFDVYIIEGQTEVWISDNISIKVYDAYDFSYKYKVSFPFIIHKFKRMNSSNILLVTGQSEYSLTLTDKEGVVLSEYLEKEIPFLMFRPVQFLKYGTDYLFQLGISNAYIAFNPETGIFKKGIFSEDHSFLSDKKLLELFNVHGMEFIREANKGSYISNLVPLNNTLWIQSNHSGKNCLTKVQPGYQMVSNMFSSGWQIENDLFDLDDSSFVSTITMSESDDSILMYIDSYVLSNNDKPIHDKYGNTIECHSEDNPCIIEFF